MGSRGFTFVTTRGMISTGILNDRLRRDFMPSRRDTLLVVNSGSAYFASDQNHGRLFPSGKFSWADDHGTNFVRFERAWAPCPRYSFLMPTFAHVKSTDRQEDSDEHFWFPTLGWDEEPARERHTLGSCLDPLSCPGMWPIFVDYSPVRVVQQSDNWGQPKNYAVIQRDYRVRDRADPWSLDFRFNFTGQQPTEFDNRGVRLADGTDISRQTALSAGIAYYHRRDHWREPPNLLNPYWRATLVPLTVDAQGRGGDVADTLDSVNAPWAADAWRALRGAGYQGGP
jgi:hypothetical protein